MAFTAASVTLLILFTTLLLVPRFTGYVLRAALRSAGWFLKNRTNGRREVILSRVRLEEEDYRSKNPSSTAGPEDEDWEKVDSAPGVAKNGEPLGENWEGIIGFFHPFW
jgi:alpha-1,2-mannosyltransferase